MGISSIAQICFLLYFELWLDVCVDNTIFIGFCCDVIYGRKESVSKGYNMRRSFLALTTSTAMDKALS